METITGQVKSLDLGFIPSPSGSDTTLLTRENAVILGFAISLESEELKAQYKKTFDDFSPSSRKSFFENAKRFFDQKHKDPHEPFPQNGTLEAEFKFKECFTFKFGYPNDEGLEKHPLFMLGLNSYGIYEVIGSSWVNSIPKLKTADPDLGIANLSYRHFIFVFHDSSFECLAKDYEYELDSDLFDKSLTSITENK